jgi:AcrR family transcriptional regulator
MPKLPNAGTSATADETDSLSPVERKRRDTWDRIIRQAESLMRNQADRNQASHEFTIQDITDAADIGHGTFIYLHFKSKYEMLIPVVEQQTEGWDEINRRRLSDVSDPAILLASSGRYMAKIIVADPLWRWVLQHSGVRVDDVRQPIGRFGARDFGRGLVSGRFQVPELTIAPSYMLGGFVNGLQASFDSGDPKRTIDQTVEMFLRVVGLAAQEPERIANLLLLELE